MSKPAILTLSTAADLAPVQPQIDALLAALCELLGADGSDPRIVSLFLSADGPALSVVYRP